MNIFQRLKTRFGVALRNLAKANQIREIQNARKWDRLTYAETIIPEFEGLDQDGWYTNSGLKKLKDHFGINFRKKATELLQKNKGPLNVLDLGAGQGLFGIELQDAVGLENVRLHAVGLTRPYNVVGGRWTVQGRALARICAEPWNRFESFRVGDFRKKADDWFEDEKFDLIVSHSVPFLTLHNLHVVADKLAQKGEAYLHIQLGSARQLEEKSDALAKAGLVLKVLRQYQSGIGPVGFVQLVKTRQTR